MRTAIPIIILLLAVNTMNVFGQEVSFSYDKTNKKLNIRLGVQITDPDQLQDMTLKLWDKTDKTGIILVETKSIPKQDIKNINDEEIGLVFNLTSSLTSGRKYEVRIYSAGILWTSFDVDTGLTATFYERNDPICRGGIPMVLVGRLSDSDEPDVNGNQIGDDTEGFWINILDHLKQNDLHKKLTVETSMGQAEILQIESALLHKYIAELINGRIFLL